jgi:hypothetical protein
MKELLKKSDEVSRRRFMSRAASTFLGVGMMPAANEILSGKVYGAGANASKMKQVPTAKNVIYLYMSGGMTHLDTFDPKPGAETQGPTQAIKTSADGVRIGEYLPKTAQQMHHACVINSLSSTQGAHEQGRYFMHTSYTLRGTIRHPAMGAWLLKFQDRLNSTLPGNVVIGNGSRHPGAGFFEAKFSPLMINNPQEGLQNSKRMKDLSEDQFHSRIDLAKKLDEKFQDKYSHKGVRAYKDMYDDAVGLMQSKDLEAFDLTQEPAELREAYGDDPFGQGCLLARRLVENNVRFVEVSLGGWDTHQGNFVRVPERCDILDRGLATLLEDLHRRGLLDETLVVVATEFGRTPDINQNVGRDHYPKAFSCMLAGGGVKGGTIYGKTDKEGREVVENKVLVPDLNATIGYGLGLPLDHVLYSPSKRPFTLAHDGQPFPEIFA